MLQKQKLAEEEGLQAAVRLSRSDHARVRQLVEAGLYRSFADFLREAVRDKLSCMEVVSVKKVEPKEAEHMIENYLKEHPGYFAEAQRQLDQWYIEGKLRPAVSRTYPLAQAIQALDDLAARQVVGKAALTMAG